MTRADKIALQRRLGLDSLEQLYNLANRLGVTRSHQEQIAGSGSERQAPAFAAERLTLREDPATTVFTREGDEYLRRHFGVDARTRRHLEEIAFHLSHTETAIMYRARVLGLRRWCKYWQAEKIIAWTGLSETRLRELGVDFYPCLDRDGQLAVTLVSTSSLMRLIAFDMAADQPEDEEPEQRTGSSANHHAELVAAGADGFLLAELADLRREIDSGSDPWERSRWVSHGHVCLNPWAGLSFMLFDDGRDHKVPARGLHPSDLHPSLLSEF
ncbi:hypothetical protein [Miltoncostaea oceani]|uniref:hypothetical protein n=1 Tax=Miltoncostaea oceani TaxID=2843216 RepID=UPI001C3D13C8|nr:hypothetical protein [Miltoncostaea oceani]